MRRFAAFDIDGTLVRWQLYHAIVDGLAAKGHMSAEDYESIRQARKNWKKRSPGASFKKYEQTLVDIYKKNLINISPDQMNGIIEAVFEEYKDQVYTYTRDLVARLKAEDYLLFAISGSHEQIVSKIAKHYGFDDFKGTVFEQSNSKFTGTVQAGYQNKDLALKELVEAHGASFEGSYAVGDSFSDSKMMELVENPIAFNPDAELLKVAKSKSWKIVIERKNVVYELEKTDGRSYILA